MKERLKAFLSSKQWKYIENNTIIKIDVEGENLSWSSFFKTDDKESLCCFGVLPVKVPQSRFDFMIKLINAVNTRIWFGSFELITDGSEAGQLRLRTSQYIPEDVAENSFDELVEPHIIFNMTAMNIYAPALIKAVFEASESIDDYLGNI